MYRNRLIAGLLVLLLLGTLLCACQRKPDNMPVEPLTPETVEPIRDEDRLDYTDDPTLSGQIELLRDTFVEVTAAPESDFWYRVDDGGAILVAYTGESKTVRVPDTLGGAPVRVIESEAFADKTALEALYLPDSVTAIGTSVLKGCKSLTALRTPFFGAAADGTQFLGYLFGASSHENNSRDVPSSLLYLEIGGNATRLADFSLFECNDLLCISLPLNMTEIGRFALYGCSRLVAINTEHLTLLDANAMDGCAALTCLEFGASLTTIGLGALESCDSLHRLTLPFVGGSRTQNTYLAYIFGAEIPEFAKGFYPSKLTDVILLDGAETLGNYAFFSCESLTALTLPEGVREIGLRAFDGCVRLQKIDLPRSLSKIGANAFYGCLSLRSVSFAENASLQSLGVNAFYKCHALEKIVLPRSLTALPASCFADCLSLSEIDLGGVKTVGKNAFHRCQSLQTVHTAEELTVEDGNPLLEAILHPEEK